MTTVKETKHLAPHDGITATCPLSCLGLHTVGDLLRLLAETGRTTTLRVSRPGPRPHDRRQRTPQITLDSPILHLGLHTPILTALRSSTSVRTIRDLLHMLEHKDPRTIHGIGPRRVEHIRNALTMAGFSPSPAQS